jgi:glycosyltransferase involved in cell wall biosynthesis
MPALVVHILGNSGVEGTGIGRVVSSIHRYISSPKYLNKVCLVGQPGPMVDFFEQQGITVSVVPWKHPSRDPVGLLRLLRHIRQVRPEILHFHWGGAHVRHFTRRFSGAKIVQHLHSSADETDALAAPSSTDHSDVVIAVSDAVSRGSHHGRTVVIRSGIELPERVAAHGGSNTIGFAGRLCAVKGAEHLLRAMSLLHGDFPALRLEIAGDGPLRGELESLSTSLGLQQNVRFLGWVESLQMHSMEWSALVQPSLAEALSLTALEAMAAGLPVIASNVGGLAEVVDDGKTGLLVPAADPRLLADSIRRLLVDPALAARMGEAGRNRVREKFQARDMAARIEAVYDGLLAK